VSFQNRSAAASANRRVRMAILSEYVAFIRARAQADARDARARFDEIRAEYEAAVRAFFGQCVGGPLAWGAFVKLQEDLRIEQVSAREQLLRDEVRSGSELPELSRSLKEARAVARLLGERDAPSWLSATEQP
jgi:hypothetical protein